MRLRKKQRNKLKRSNMAKCIFCSRFADSGRFAQNQHMPLCEDHYQEKTLGEVVAQFKKIPKKEDKKVEVKTEAKKEVKVETKLKKDGYPFNKLKRKK